MYSSYLESHVFQADDQLLWGFSQYLQKISEGYFKIDDDGSLQIPVTLVYIISDDMASELQVDYPLSYGVPVRERYGSTLLPATREQHDQNCTQSH